MNEEAGTRYESVTVDCCVFNCRSKMLWLSVLVSDSASNESTPQTPSILCDECDETTASSEMTIKFSGTRNLRRKVKSGQSHLDRDHTSS